MNTAVRSPEQALASIPGFAGVRVELQLSDGPTNASFELEQGGDRFVLRIDKPAAAGYGLDRAAELEVIQVLADAGLGESPVYYDAVSGVSLRSFIPGRSWAEADLHNPANLEQLARLLWQVHQLPPVGRNFDPVSSAARYVEQLGTSEAQAVYRDIETEFASLQLADQVLCHNDLVCGNILESDRLMLIDWEWAGVGDPFFDLAVVVQHHGLSGELSLGFLAAYLEREPSVAEVERLDRQCYFYQLLLSLWDLL